MPALIFSQPVENFPERSRASATKVCDDHGLLVRIFSDGGLTPSRNGTHASKMPFFRKSVLRNEAREDREE